MSSYSIVGYKYVSFSGLITSVGEERALLSVWRGFRSSWCLE